MNGNYWTQRRVSRRAALRGAGVGAAGIAGAALIGCGDSDEDPTAAPTTDPGGTDGTATAEATQVRETTTPASSTIKRGGTYSIAATGDPPTINPYGNASFAGKVVAAFTYNRLYKRETFAGSDGGQTLPAPDAAVSAESPDGIVWTVKLRDIEMHDVAPVSGRKLNSEDVLSSVARL